MLLLIRAVFRICGIAFWGFTAASVFLVGSQRISEAELHNRIPARLLPSETRKVIIQKLFIIQKISNKCHDHIVQRCCQSLRRKSGFPLCASIYMETCSITERCFPIYSLALLVYSLHFLKLLPSRSYTAAC